MKGIDIFAVAGVERAMKEPKGTSLDMQSKHYAGLVANYSFLFGNFGATAYWRKDRME